MPVPNQFFFTAHGTQRGNQRKITVEQFKACVISPNTKRQVRRGAHGGFVYHHTKKLDSKTLHVFAEVHKNNCWFVTGYWE